ncbi:serine/threonine-protein kinase [Pseudonocardia nigra]|uniref:serine/threonine-protein kinase n=1 Tax=Pseudonocardia nigra TaxID=1921578 RepID=UPI001C5FEB4D|nr:serine/threonine-protein kinase [Pseudonocardia nigra]
MNVLAAGQKIADRYQLERRIAVGGMGEVWEASDTRLGRSVAVKVLRPELSDDPEFLHRFRIEARTVASLDHSGIAAVHDYGEDDGPAPGQHTAYLVMELVRGEPLSTLIGRGPIDPDETLRLLEEAGWALQAAHERGFVHRDVKPGNILVRTDGLVKLTDFGIAKAADAVPVTRSGMVMGTAHYIAPEQASGAEAGPAGDVYSLGIVGYECLAGHRPFRAESAVAVAMMQVREEPPPLPAGVPQAARELIDAVLVKDPGRRYATGGEFALAVAAVRRGEPLPAPASVTGVTAAVPLRSTATPSRGRSRVPLGTPPPAAAPAPHEFGDTPEPTPPPRRRSSGHPPVAPAPRSEPLRLQPTAGMGRSLLLVLFVLLTVAAVVVGVFVFRGLGEGGAQQPDATPSSAPAGTVAGWKGVLARPAAPGGGPGPVLHAGVAR